MNGSMGYVKKAGAVLLILALILSNGIPVMAEESSDLPFGLPGMDQGFVLSEENINDKAANLEHDVAGTVASLTPDVDYVRDRIMYSADSQEYAEEVAAAYNAELESYAYGIAVAVLTDPEVTVAQAVAAGADPLTDLPAVSPVYIVPIEEPVESDDETVYVGSSDSSPLTGSATSARSWSDVVKEYDDPAFDPEYRFAEHSIKYDQNDQPVVVTPSESEYKNGYQWMHDMIGTYEAWGTTRGSNKVTVAVIDSGVDVDHEDLMTNDLRSVTLVPEEDLRAILGGGTPLDTAGHGTHVAGIISMTPNNKKGGVGVAPGVNILGVPISKEATDSSGRTYATTQTSDICRAIRYVACADSDREPYAQLINMSLGYTQYSVELDKAIKTAIENNVTVVASAGNDATNIIKYPACYDGVISVAAVDRDGNRTYFSTYGYATIAAPGALIYSTVNGHNAKTNYPYVYSSVDHNDWYAALNGTSMAAPVVTGVCALYISYCYEKTGKYPTPSEVRDAITKSATANPDKLIGAGIVNAAALFEDTAKSPDTSSVSIKFKKDASETEFRELTSGTELGEGSSIRFEAPENISSFGYLYTVNGSNPVMKDGICSKGTFRADNDQLIGSGELVSAGVGSGEPFTLKAAYVSAKGTIGKIVTVKDLKLAGDEPSAGAKLVIYGSKYAAAGKSVSFTAGLDPADPSFLKKHGVKWSLANEVPGIAISSSGKLSVKKNVPADTEITITASINGDDDIAPAQYRVVVKPPVTNVTAKARISSMTDYEKKVHMPVEKKGTLSSVRLYNVDILSTEDTDESAIFVDAGTDLGEQSRLSFSSSNLAVAHVEYDEKENTFVIRAGKKAGSAKITFAATDGSNKKATFSVNTIVPMSGVSINTKDGQAALAYGKSLQLTATPGRTYGNPTITKLTWDFGVSAVFSCKGKTDQVVDMTKEFKDKKLASISSSGKLSLNKKADFIPVVPDSAGEGYAFSKFIIKVSASATDGTGCLGTYSVYAAKPTQSIKCYGIQSSNKLVEVKEYNADLSKIGNVSKDHVHNVTFLVELSGSDRLDERTIIQVSSTNPEAIGFSKALGSYVTVDGKKLYRLTAVIREKGSGKINIRARDGSGKKLTIPFKVF
ncbi:MAG: S8 family serine peptidase [Lachnospiraceae bacterium]|nr:S8 family serine peptidase [Lachnospiraceae bacterium]